MSGRGKTINLRDMPQAEADAIVRALRGPSTKVDQEPSGDLARRVARMLTTAAAIDGADHGEKWSRVNRAAGMVAFEAAQWSGDSEAAGAAAENLLAMVAPLVEGEPAQVAMVTRGISKRVGRALLEWYTGESPA